MVVAGSGGCGTGETVSDTVPIGVCGRCLDPDQPDALPIEMAQHAEQLMGRRSRIDRHRLKNRRSVV